MEGLSRSRSTAGTKVTGYQTTLATLRPLPRVARPVKDGVGRTDTHCNRYPHDSRSGHTSWGLTTLTALRILSQPDSLDRVGRLGGPGLCQSAHPVTPQSQTSTGVKSATTNTSGRG